MFGNIVRLLFFKETKKRTKFFSKKGKKKIFLFYLIFLGFDSSSQGFHLVKEFARSDNVRST
jgi:hypothetical protein